MVLPGCRIDGGNCRCPAGETQSCVHISALLFTLAEVTPIACTSLPCAWSFSWWGIQVAASAE